MNLNNKDIKTYSAELVFSGKEIISLPITYAKSSIKGRKLTVEEPEACDLENSKTRLLLEISSDTSFNVIVSANNQKEATNAVLNSPLRQLDNESASTVKCLGLEGRFGAVTEVSKLEDESISRLIDYAKSHLPTINYGDFVVEESKVKPKVASLKELSKLPSKKSGVSYDVSQKGIVTNECVAYLSYSGAKKAKENGVEKIHLRDIRLIPQENVFSENQEGRRVIMAHYSQDSELVGRLQVDKLSDCDKSGAALRQNLKRLHSLHTNTESNPNVLSKENLMTIREILINNELQGVESTIVKRDSFVTKKITRSKELTHEM